jgi:hypothetical protein
MSPIRKFTLVIVGNKGFIGDIAAFTPVATTRMPASMSECRLVHYDGWGIQMNIFLQENEI